MLVNLPHQMWVIESRSDGQAAVGAPRGTSARYACPPGYYWVPAGYAKHGKFRLAHGEDLGLLGIGEEVHPLRCRISNGLGACRPSKGGTSMSQRVPGSHRTREALRELMEGRCSESFGRTELVQLATRLIIEEGLDACRRALAGDQDHRLRAPPDGCAQNRTRSGI